MIRNKKRWLKKFMPLAIACAGLFGYQPSGFAENIYGGGSEETRESVTDNQLSVDDDADVVMGGVSADGDVRDNAVEINGGSHVGASGGLSVVNNELKNASGNVTGNRIVIHGGTIRFVSGGEVAYTYALDGSSALTSDEIVTLGRGDVSDNVVEIDGGTITGRVTGGTALSGSARNNVVRITGGTINGEIVGGMVREATDGSEISGNSIVFGLDDTELPAPELIDVALIGGKFLNGDVDSGGRIFNNTLTIQNMSGLRVRSVEGFDQMNFRLPSTGDTMLIVEGGAPTRLDGTTINISARGDNARVDTGLELNLIRNENNLEISPNIQLPTALQKGHSDRYEIYLVTDEGDPIASYTEENTASSAAIDSDGKFVTKGLHARVGDKISSLPSIIDEVVDGQEARVAEDIIKKNNNDWKPHEDEFREIQDMDEEVSNEMKIFAGAHAGSLRTKLNSGGHVNNKTLGFGFGGTKTLVSKNNGNHFSFAPIIDYGKGKFDSYTSGGEHGSGDTHFAAGGLIARRMLTNGFYYEGSVRYGRAKSSFSSNDFPEYNGDTYAEYDLSAPIFAGHVNVGKLFAINRENTVHVYGQYLHAHQGSMSTNLSSGEHYDFDSVDDGTFAVGVRFINQPNKLNKFYSGFAYQYDHSSGSSASHDGQTTKDVDSNGGSGMIELGWELKPHDAVPWVIDLGAIGWVGQQKGLTFHAKVKKSF